ncbi:MAG TPA: cytochrome c oxidase subunit 3 [Patescibacteria group bacterium]|nr:cytochrome c oxidase subunit 3 [Patescibacteria group bacterium]
MSDEPVYDLQGGKHHPYHLVNPSPWPFVGSMAAGLLAALAVMYMHKVTIFGISPGLIGVVLGFAGVAALMAVWWRDVIQEAVVEKAHTPIVKIGFRYGMALFIASEVMFFVAFFWAFFDGSLHPREAIGFAWPPKGVEAIKAFDLPFLMTLILLLSGCTVTWAHHAILEGKKDEATKALLVTVLLGAVFTCFQAYEYVHSTTPFTHSIYSSAFYMATGFHGFHVLVGSIFLAVCLFRNMKGHFTAQSHFGFEAAAWYWHFVDVVWLFLFVAIYWWGNA